MITEFEYISTDGANGKQKCKCETPEEVFAEADLRGWKVTRYYADGNWITAD